MRREMCTGDLDHFTIGAPVQDTRLDIPSYPEEEERQRKESPRPPSRATTLQGNFAAASIYME